MLCCFTALSLFVSLYRLEISQYCHVFDVLIARPRILPSSEGVMLCCFTAVSLFISRFPDCNFFFHFPI